MVNLRKKWPLRRPKIKPDYEPKALAISWRGNTKAAFHVIFRAVHLGHKSAEAIFCLEPTWHSGLHPGAGPLEARTSRTRKQLGPDSPSIRARFGASAWGLQTLPRSCAPECYLKFAGNANAHAVRALSHSAVLDSRECPRGWRLFLILVSSQRFHSAHQGHVFVPAT